MDTPLLLPETSQTRERRKDDPTMRELYERLKPVPAPPRDSHALVRAKIDEAVRVHKERLLAGERNAYWFEIHVGGYPDEWSKLPPLLDDDIVALNEAQEWACEKYDLYVVMRDPTPPAFIRFSVKQPTFCQKSCLCIC